MKHIIKIITALLFMIGTSFQVNAGTDSIKTVCDGGKLTTNVTLQGSNNRIIFVEKNGKYYSFDKDSVIAIDGEKLKILTIDTTPDNQKSCLNFI